ncbi:acyltransferase [Streptomyces candidus]|nr:acyltransferase [Streptomyces candidus]
MNLPVVPERPPARTGTTRRQGPARPAGESGPHPHRSVFRPDIEGLRAVAVLAVLAFHAGIPGLAGGFVGVDVFFVISGYLITGLLAREAVSTGRVRLGDFFSRRARRLLPSAAVVLAAVAVAGAWLTAPLRRTDLANDVLAAALSVANWRFVSQQTDYLAAGHDQSPLLHFWSLAVEEQFYLLWAPLLALCAFAAVRGLRAARRGRAVRGAVALLAVPLVLGTFALSLYWTGESAALAYLSTPARVWQFGVGALLALLPWHLLRGPRPLRLLCGWAGVAAVVGSVLVYDATTPYPGTAALVPTLGTAAVILAAIPGRGERNVQGAYGVGRLLAGRAPRAIGRLSYNLYLWHWPVLVLAEVRLGPLDWPAKTALTLAAVLPALATLRWVEQPLRRSRTVSELPRRGLAVGVSAVVLPVVLALVMGTTALQHLGPAQPVDLKGLPQGAVTGPGLLARTPGTRPPQGPPEPSPLQARKDFPPDGACQVAPAETRSPTCLFGAADSPGRIVLLGDSHAGQWFSPLLALASQRGWALQELVKQGCPLPRLTVHNPQLGRTYHECDTWRADTLDRLKRGPRPRLIVVSSLNRYTADHKLLKEAWKHTLTALRGTGAPIVRLEDTPVPGKDIPACVSGHLDDPQACDFPRSDALRPDPLPQLIAAGAVPGVHGVGVNEVLCPPAAPTCPAVRDGILLYRDDAHLTNVAAVLLTGRLERLLTSTGALPPPATPAGARPGAGTKPDAGMPGTGTEPDAAGWTEVFRDGFEGPARSRPRSAHWQYDLGTCCPGCRTAFHTYAVEVDLAPGAEEIRWYVDGRVHHRVRAAGMDRTTWDRAVNHGVFLILNVAIGGKLPEVYGAVPGPATQPGHAMRVDFVRVATREASL